MIPAISLSLSLSLSLSQTNKHINCTHTDTLKPYGLIVRGNTIIILDVIIMQANANSYIRITRK